MVMIDLQKAFDTVDHDILSNKLKAIGLDDLSTSWFSSYLKNRFQKTEVDGIFSHPMVVPCGTYKQYRTTPTNTDTCDRIEINLNTYNKILK